MFIASLNTVSKLANTCNEQNQLMYTRHHNYTMEMLKLLCNREKVIEVTVFLSVKIHSDFSKQNQIILTFSLLLVTKVLIIFSCPCYTRAISVTVPKIITNQTHSF